MQKRTSKKRTEPRGGGKKDENKRKNLESNSNANENRRVDAERREINGTRRQFPIKPTAPPVEFIARLISGQITRLTRNGRHATVCRGWKTVACVPKNCRCNFSNERRKVKKNKYKKEMKRQKFSTIYPNTLSRNFAIFYSNLFPFFPG